MSAEDAVRRIETAAGELRAASRELAELPEATVDGALADRLGGAVNAIKASLDIIRARSGDDDAISDE
ncbi:MAG: hypothetical protein ABR591_09725 [Candidatus Velthaea sp.]